jgi:hypothetical protein
LDEIERVRKAYETLLDPNGYVDQKEVTEIMKILLKEFLIRNNSQKNQ